MRFTTAPGPGQVWGFSFRRTIQRLNETGDWTARPRGEQGIVSRWGHVVFESDLDPPRRIEWLPYVRCASSVPASGTDFTGGVGVDLRVGIGSAATLSATVNPDFGQVEQDPAVLNLSVFETFFPEKRSFFLEDSRTFVPPVRPVSAVSLAPHRPAPDSVCAPDGRCRGRSPGGDDDRRRGEAHRQAIRLDLRRADRADVG